MKYTISNSGCGGFLNPPGHPEHNYCVEGRRGKRVDEIVSLKRVSKNESGYYPTDIVIKCKNLLNKWNKNKPSLESEEVREWVLQCLGYFRGCYIPESGSRNVSDLIFDNKRNPMEHADTHRGIDHVRQWYPEYVPSQEDFDNAYWGKKPE